jgi:hypothetical protein
MNQTPMFPARNRIGRLAFEVTKAEGPIVSIKEGSVWVSARKNTCITNPKHIKRLIDLVREKSEKVLPWSFVTKDGVTGVFELPVGADLSFLESEE